MRKLRERFRAWIQGWKDAFDEVAAETREHSTTDEWDRMDESKQRLLKAMREDR